jgi:hypothetical protein
MKQRHILLNILTVSVLVMATATPVYGHGGETFALYFGGIFLIGGAISGVLNILFRVRPWLSFLIMALSIYVVMLVMMLIEPSDQDVEIWFYLFPISLVGSFGAIPFVVSYLGTRLFNDWLIRWLTRGSS